VNINGGFSTTDGRHWRYHQVDDLVFSFTTSIARAGIVSEQASKDIIHGEALSKVIRIGAGPPSAITARPIASLLSIEAGLERDLAELVVQSTPFVVSDDVVGPIDLFELLFSTGSPISIWMELTC
jgi:hypothetical protein